ncbi:WG repeat-containing protein [Campylobacter concisus]
MKQTFEIVGEFKDGLARIKKFGNYGFIDEAGEQVIACNFSDASDFCEGLARVKKFGKFGFIDKNGVQVIECKFDDADDFCNGFAKVKLNGKWFEIDSSGKDPNVSESSEEIQTEISNVDVIKLKKDESEDKAEILKDDVAISDKNKVEKSIKIDDIKSSTVVKNMVEVDGKWYETSATNGEDKIEISKDGNFVIVDENNNKVEIPGKFCKI